MLVTAKGQVTIPRPIREKLGLTPHCEVEFLEQGDRIYIRKAQPAPQPSPSLRALRGCATVPMTTDQIMALTRGDEA